MKHPRPITQKNTSTHLLPNYLAPLASLVDRDHDRVWKIEGVHIQVNPKTATFVAEVTDAKLAVRVSGPMDPADGLPVPPALQRTDAPAATAARVPDAEFARVFDEAEKASIRNVVASFTKGTATFAVPGLDSQSVSECQTIPRRYPRVGQLLAEIFDQPPIAECRIDAKHMAKLLTVLAKLAEASEAGVIPVVLAIRPGHPMTITAPGKRPGDTVKAALECLEPEAETPATHGKGDTDKK